MFTGVVNISPKTGVAQTRQGTSLHTTICGEVPIFTMNYNRINKENENKLKQAWKENKYYNHLKVVIKTNNYYMKTIIKYIIAFIVVIVVICSIILYSNNMFSSKYSSNIVAGNSDYSTHYTTVSLGDSFGVKTTPFRLTGLILGSDTSSASVSLFDNTTGAGTPIAVFTGSTLHGYYPLGLDMSSLSFVVTAETGVTFIWGNP